jgi:hypothetical protein
MTASQLTVALWVDAMVLAALAGLIVRGRWRMCLAFVPYLSAALAYNLSVVLWPERFYQAWFWMVAHAAFDALRMAVALEIAFRFSRQVRSVRPSAGHAALVALVALAIGTTSMRSFDTGPAWIRYHGDLWTMVAILALAAALRVRLDGFHTALLAGFGIYLGVYALPLGITRFWWPESPWAPPWWAPSEPFAYLLLVCWWAYAALRPPSSAGVTGSAPGTPPVTSLADERDETPPQQLAVGVAGVWPGSYRPSSLR